MGKTIGMFQQRSRHTDSEESEGIPTMRKTTRKLAAMLISAVCTVTAALPAFSCGCTAAETPAAEAAEAPCRIVSFTASEQLAAMIAEIESGACSLYLTNDKNSAPAEGLAVEGAIDRSAKYYTFTKSGASTNGKQCYIYAQAAYGKLFDELPLHGPDETTVYQHSEQAAGYAPALTPSYLTDHAVMPGAYMRTTANYDGSYNSSAGHSMILLGYNRNKVRILEANANSLGLIRDVELTYEQFNRIYLERKNRFIGQVIQPTAAYYRDNFGLVFGDFPFEEWEPSIMSGGAQGDPEVQGGFLTTTAEAVPEETTVTTAETAPAPAEPVFETTVSETAVSLPQTTVTTAQTAVSEPETTAAVSETAAPVRALPDISLHHFLDAVPLSVPEGKIVSWTSSDPEIAAVDETGSITPGTAAGTAVITAKTEDAVWQVRVTSDSVTPETLGDFDGDGSVDAYDAQLALVYYSQFIIGFDDEYDAETLHRADADGDGQVTAYDATLILSFFTETTVLHFWDDAESGWTALLNP